MGFRVSKIWFKFFAFVLAQDMIYGKFYFNIEI